MNAIAYAANWITFLGMIGVIATGFWLFRLLQTVSSARAIALNMLYPTSQLLFVMFFWWCLALSKTTPNVAMLMPLPICCVVCIIGNILMFPNLPLHARSQQFELETKRLSAVTEASLCDLHDRNVDIIQASQWRLKADDQISMLRSALCEHDLAGVERATDLIAGATGYGRVHLCDHPAANALLMVEYDRMRKSGITVDCKAEIPRVIGIDGASICAVIGNLVDNAINACAAMREEGRIPQRPWIRIRINTKQGNNGSNLIIRVNNSHCGTCDDYDGADTRPGFPEHGWGLRIVNEIAKQHNGTFSSGVGEDAAYGLCWYAIATLVVNPVPTLQPQADYMRDHMIKGKVQL